MLRMLFQLVLCLMFAVCDVAMSGSPTTYCPRVTALKNCPSQIPIFVRSLKSDKTLTSYGYESFDFCHSDNYSMPAVKQGQSVFGEKQEVLPGPFQMEFLTTVKCQIVCKKEYVAGEDTDAALGFIKKGISLNYQQYWDIGHVPMLGCFLQKGCKQVCKRGFPIGAQCERDTNFRKGCLGEKGTFFIYNHLDITVTFSPGKEDDSEGMENPLNSGRIVSVSVEPRSINNVNKALDEACFPTGSYLNNDFLKLPNTPVEKKFSFWYTYSINWIPYISSNENPEMDRIEVLEKSPLYAKYSAGIFAVGVLLPFVGLNILFARMLFAYRWGKLIIHEASMFNKYNIRFWSGVSSKRILDREIARPPKRCLLLAVLIGNGVQIFCTTVIVLTCVSLGIISSGSDKESVVICIVISYVCLGILSGFCSGRIFKLCGGARWITLALTSFLVCPGLLFAIYVLKNIPLWIDERSSTMTLTSLIKLLLLFVVTEIPLIFIGTYYGFKNISNGHQFVTKALPRDITDMTFWQKCLPLTAGFIPFGLTLVQQHNILVSVWFDLQYTSFGALFCDFIVLTITCATTSAVVCLSYLEKMDYHWWWRSFITGGFTSVYIFIHCTIFFLTKLQLVGYISNILYFGYTLMTIFLLFLLTGSVGFLACFWYIHTIYEV